MRFSQRQNPHPGTEEKACPPPLDQSGGSYHATAWVLWLLAALTTIALTQNPLYLVVAILMVSVNYLGLSRSAPTAHQWGALLRLGLALVLLTATLNLLSVSTGDTRLFTLPTLRWELITLPQQPPLAIQLGGPATLEGLVYGLTTGLALIGVLLTFATFNALVDHYQLLRATPRFLYQSAIVTSIAITFVPQMVAAQREIREAQALRGHRFRGIRDLAPLFVALLAEGLERSITLAESMEARGFGGQPLPAAPGTVGAGRSKESALWAWPLTDRSLLGKSVIALALTVLVSGAFALSYFPQKALGGATLLIGGAMLLVALWMIGQGVQRSRYRRDRWRRRDTLVAVTSTITMLVILIIWATHRSLLTFYPYPRVTWPSFNPFIGLTLSLLAAPALTARLRGAAAHDGVPCGH